MKKQFSLRKKHFLMFLGGFLLLVPFFAFAADYPNAVVSVSGDTCSYRNDAKYNSYSIAVEASSHLAAFTYDKYTPESPVYTTTEFNPDTGTNDTITVCPAVARSCDDTTDNPNDAYSGNPGSGFCAAMDSCATSTDIPSCRYAIATAYKKKIEDNIKNAISGKVSSSGIDGTSANDAIATCGGDLACINSTLGALQTDSSFNKSSNSTSSATLTTSSLSDLINSNQDTSSTNVLNASQYDPTGQEGKVSGPQVEVIFNSLPQQGTKITANAIPSYFNNNSDPKNLYFTWYVKHKNCDLTDNVSDKNKECDLDDDGKITVNDWKITAAKIAVKGNFDSSTADYSKKPDTINGRSFSGDEYEKASGYKAIPAIDDSKGGLNIGWRAGQLKNGNGDFYSDNGQSDDVRNCYVQAGKSGFYYELRSTDNVSKFADSEGDSSECPSGYHRACVADQQVGCNVFSSSTNAPISQQFNVCSVFSERIDTQNNHDGVFCTIKSDDDLKNFKGTLACDSQNGKNLYAICVKNDPNNSSKSLNSFFKDSSQNILGVIAGSSGNACNAIALPDSNNSGLFQSTPIVAPQNETCSIVKDEIINGTKTASGTVAIAGNSNLEPKCEFQKGDNVCKHLFPNFPKNSITLSDGSHVDMSGVVTGDGKFSLAEKHFWGTDPKNSSTDNSGTDEQKIVGLGEDSFSWTYVDGDEVGVAVEGDSTFQSSHPNDKNYRRMWAFSKGKCGVLDKIESSSSINQNHPDENGRAFYMDGSQGIKTTNVDLDDCLEDNLIDPTSSDSSQEIADIIGKHVELGFSPENPINDPEGNGDILSVSADSLNFQNLNGISYQWYVLLSKSGTQAPIDSTKWVDITSLMKKGGSFNESDLSGFGKNKLDINLNLQNSDVDNSEIFYLKVRVKATGTGVDSNDTIMGETKPIRVSQQTSVMHVYSVSATSSGTTSITPLELCYDQQSKKMLSSCYVFKNQILGMVVSGTSPKASLTWTVNGNQMTCNTSVSQDCNKGNVLIFPVLGNVGEAINVEAKGVNDKNEVIDITKHLIIGQSQLGIYSADNNIWPKLLGYYRTQGSGGSCLADESGCVKDLSNEVMETNNGNTITLNAYGQFGFTWTVDGQEMTENQDNPQLSFVAEKPVGDSYNVSLFTRLTPDSKIQMNNLSYALNKNWGIVADELVDENQNASIQIDVVGSGNQQASSTSAAASLITHLPEQAMFLFKLTLTSVTLFLVTGLLFALMPERLFRE